MMKVIFLIEIRKIELPSAANISTLIGKSDTELYYFEIVHVNFEIIVNYTFLFKFGID